MSSQEPAIRWDWVFSHLGDIEQRLVEHLVLSVIAVAVGFAISFLLSLAIRRFTRLYDPITWLTGVLYTIPSLALFALLVPFTRLTIWTAEIGLVSYTLLILIRNIIAGFRSVPGEVREAAVGMGYAPHEFRGFECIILSDPKSDFLSCFASYLYRVAFLKISFYFFDANREQAHRLL